MTVTKLNLCNFSSVHTMYIHETFFYNVCVAKRTTFYFCPCSYKSLKNGKKLKESIVYNKKPSEEIICDCLKYTLPFVKFSVIIFLTM